MTSVQEQIAITCYEVPELQPERSDYAYTHIGYDPEGSIQTIDTYVPEVPADTLFVALDYAAFSEHHPDATFNDITVLRERGYGKATAFTVFRPLEAEEEPYPPRSEQGINLTVHVGRLCYEGWAAAIDTVNQFAKPRPGER